MTKLNHPIFSFSLVLYTAFGLEATCMIHTFGPRTTHYQGKVSPISLNTNTFEGFWNSLFVFISNYILYVLYYIFSKNPGQVFWYALIGHLSFLLVKSSENDFILLCAFYLILWFMKSPIFFDQIAILKIGQLISF